jgi:hypothetical protein
MVLGVWIATSRQETASPSTQSRIEAQARVVAGTPGLSDPPLRTGSHSDGAPRGKVSISVKKDEYLPFKPLMSGSLRIRAGSHLRSFPIKNGAATIVGSVEAGDWRTLRVHDSEGQLLFSHLDGAPSEGQVQCYAYPGYFLRQKLPATGGAQGVLTVYSPASPVFLSRCMYPSQPADLIEVPIVRGELSYVRALESTRDYYFARRPGFAWIKILPDDMDAGDVATLDLKASGKVVLRGPELRLERTPRVIVQSGVKQAIRAKAGEVDGRVLDGWLPGVYTAFMTPSISESELTAITEVEEFEVVAGEIANVVFTLKAEYGSESSWGSLQGTLSVESWSLVEPWDAELGLRIRVQRLGPDASLDWEGLRRQKKLLPVHAMEEVMSPRLGDPIWRWNAGSYPAGRYRLHVDPLRWFVDVSVESEHATVVDCQLPTLARTDIAVGAEGVDASSLVAFLSHPEGAYPPGAPNPSPHLISNGVGSLQMISPPGRHNLAIMWKGSVYEQEVDLQPGWNSVFFPVGDGLVSTLFLVDSEGEPYNLSKEVWDAISIAHPNGDPLRLQTIFASKLGRASGLSRAKLLFDEPGMYEISGFENFGLSFVPDTIELEDRSEPTIVVRGR